jgi:hypothetical protein
MAQSAKMDQVNPTDVFMRAVGFALTGRDDADPKVIGAARNASLPLTTTFSA